MAWEAGRFEEGVACGLFSFAGGGGDWKGAWREVL